MSRRDNPPPRPPAPKLSLGKLSGRQHSTGSIAIHFNASSLLEDDDYDLDSDLTIGGKTSNAVQFEVGKPVNDNCDEPLSKSAPVSEVTTPLSSPVQTHQKLPSKHSPASEKGFIKIDENDIREFKEAPPKEKEKSFISGIREKLSDKIPDNLNAIIGKIEDQLSGETSPEDGKEKKLKNMKKSESLDSDRSMKNVGSSSDRRESFFSGLKSHSRHSSMDSENSIGLNEGSADSVPVPGEQKIRSNHNSFEMVDDFFGEEPFEDFAGGAGPYTSQSSSKNTIGKSPSYEQLQTYMGANPQKSKLGFQKFIKSKGGNVGPGRPVSMTLSGLYKSNKGSEQEEEELVEAMEAEEFFDPPEVGSQEEQSSQDTTTSDSEKSSSNAVPFQKILTITVCLFAYLIIPLPTYLSGLAMGAALATTVILCYQWLFAPPKPRTPFILPDIKKLPPLLVPEMKESRNDDGKFKGWMNELSHYNQDDYHINQTTSVYVQLEGTALRLQRPKHNIPKRAMWDEQLTSPTFIHQRHFDLLGSKVYLLPHGLVKKRIWSKKYPITIALSNSGTKWEKTLQVQGSTESDSQQASSPSKENANPSFDNVAKESCSDTLLYLFARTGREKEEWYRRLKSTSEGLPLPTKLSDLVPSIDSHLQKRHSSSSIEPATRHTRQGSTDSVSSIVSDKDVIESARPEQTLAEYLRYMAKLMPASPLSRSRVTSPAGSRKESAKFNIPQQPLICDPHILFVNTVIGRIFWDFLREPYWAEKMRDKIQRKLSKIHVPFFIDELHVTDIELGQQVPIIRRTSRPYLDDRGMWLDMDVAYSGGFHMSLETKVNLMKLKKTHTHRQDSSHGALDKKSPVTDSEEEDSAESSTDEEGGEENVVETAEGPPDAAGTHNVSTGKKLLRLVDKITASRYFQQATEYKYIKQAMEQVSNTPLQLSVELRCLSGTMTVNIPPPPTDRIWYGFRKNPRLWLSARPKVGERQVTVTHVTEWIEKKLSTEFQRVFVMPNMDDIPIPLMCDHLEPNPLEPSNTQMS